MGSSVRSKVKVCWMTELAPCCARLFISGKSLTVTSSQWSAEKLKATKPAAATTKIVANICENIPTELLVTGGALMSTIVTTDDVTNIIKQLSSAFFLLTNCSVLHTIRHKCIFPAADFQMYSTNSKSELRI